jgi:hypothetical protein
MQYYRFIFSLEQLLYRNEYQYLIQLGVDTPHIQLCQLVRDYVSLYQILPDLGSLVLFQYTPCEETCEYIIPMEDTFTILIHGIRTYGLLFPCNIIYQFHIHKFLEGTYPLLDTILQEHSHNPFQDQLQESMNQQVDEFWNNQSSGLKEDHFPSTVVTKQLEENCSICQDSMKEGEHVIILPCNHTFHSKKEGCNGIEEWYTKMDTCPLCKYKLT